MDLEQRFQQVARSTAAEMARRNKPTQAFDDRAGTRVEGWTVRSDSGSGTRGNPGRGFWEETGWTNTLVLGRDGKLYEYSYSWKEGNNIQGTEYFYSLTPASQHTMVGSQGKPFSKLTSELERLVYL